MQQTIEEDSQKKLTTLTLSNGLVEDYFEDKYKHNLYTQVVIGQLLFVTLYDSYTREMRHYLSHRLMMFPNDEIYNANDLLTLTSSVSSSF